VNSNCRYQSEQSDYKEMPGFAALRRIVGTARGSNARSVYTVATLMAGLVYLVACVALWVE
jgi:hypothetical protein